MLLQIMENPPCPKKIPVILVKRFCTCVNVHGFLWD